MSKKNISKKRSIYKRVFKCICQYMCLYLYIFCYYMSTLKSPMVRLSVLTRWVCYLIAWTARLEILMDLVNVLVAVLLRNDRRPGSRGPLDSWQLRSRDLADVPNAVAATFIEPGHSRYQNSQVLNAIFCASATHGGLTIQQPS